MTPQEIYNAAKPKSELDPEHLALLQVIENTRLVIPSRGRWMIGTLDYEEDDFETWSIWHLALRDGELRQKGWLIEDHPEHYRLRQNEAGRHWVEIPKSPQGEEESELGQKLKELAAQL